LFEELDLETALPLRDSVEVEEKLTDLGSSCRGSSDAVSTSKGSSNAGSGDADSWANDMPEMNAIPRIVANNVRMFIFQSPFFFINSTQQ